MQTIAKNTLLIVHKGKFYPAKFQVIAKKEPPKPLERWYLKISLAFLSSRICLHVGVTKRQELSRYEQQKPRRKLLNGVLKLRQPSSASGLIWFHHWSHSGQIWVDEAHLLLFAWDDVCDTRVLCRFFARVFHCWRRFIIYLVDLVSAHEAYVGFWLFVVLCRLLVVLLSWSSRSNLVR